jgi:hypothetical protein
MSEEVQKKSGVKFTYAKMEDVTIVKGVAPDSELPEIVATLEPGIDSSWKVRISDITRDSVIFDGVCYRGKTFAERFARFAIKGIFSRLGKRRRMTTNKQKKAEVQHD